MLHKHCTEGDAPEFFAVEKGVEDTGQSVGKNGIHSKNTCKFKFGVLTFDIHPIDKTSQKQTTDPPSYKNKGTAPDTLVQRHKILRNVTTNEQGGRQKE